MIECTWEERAALSPLFQEVTDTMVISCLQGHMGRAWADTLASPQSARIVTGDFCYLAGKPDRELASVFPVEWNGRVLLFADPPAGWTEMLKEHYGSQVFRFTRFAFQRDSSGFDRESLQKMANRLPEGYELRGMDEDICRMALELPWAKDFLVNFHSTADFCKRGMGVAALADGELCAGASSYSIYDGGIEIEIDTAPAYRKKGLARACAAALILRCLEKGIYPNWDAANRISLHLALSLGYRLEREYDTYSIQIGSDADEP